MEDERSVSAVSMARSEYCRCPPRLPTPTASQAAIASGANHTVISPRWTRSLGRMSASSRRGISSCTSGALSTSCRDHAPAVATMARRSSAAHRGRGIRAPTPRRGLTSSRRTGSRPGARLLARASSPGLRTFGRPIQRHAAGPRIPRPPSNVFGRLDTECQTSRAEHRTESDDWAWPRHQCPRRYVASVGEGAVDRERCGLVRDSHSQATRAPNSQAGGFKTGLVQVGVLGLRREERSAELSARRGVE